MFEHFEAQLINCKGILCKGYISSENSGIEWLNNFCAEFLQFTEKLLKFICSDLGELAAEYQDTLEVFYLCLRQIVVCTRYMERTISTENMAGVAIPAARQHFIDRMMWCLQRLHCCLKLLCEQFVQGEFPLRSLSDYTYVQLMDLLLDDLYHYSSDKQLSAEAAQKVNQDATSKSTEMRAMVDLLISHALAFANVALSADKTALSALCHKVLREYMAFHQCVTPACTNSSLRKLKAISLISALCQLEGFINEALLRLVYRIFLDHEKYSIERMRLEMSFCDQDYSSMDEMIADFDVNLDRTMQIGIFAIAFAPSTNLKTIIRSCLASLESLDSCIIPALQSKHSSTLYAELLEMHFNEEIRCFKAALKQIIDSKAFANCYYEMLCQCLTLSQQNFDKEQLQVIIDMGAHLLAHFTESLFNTNEKGRKIFENVKVMVRECKSVLKCNDQLESWRILKRFKVLRSMLRNFIETINMAEEHKKQNELELNNIEEQELPLTAANLESIGLIPSLCSILYDEPITPKRKRQSISCSDSMKTKYSQLSSPSASRIMMATQRGILHRKQSMRTVMFKRQKTLETANVYDYYKNNSADLEITEILDQLNDLSKSFNNVKQFKTK